MPTLMNNGRALGLSDSEKSKYSLSRAILGVINGSPHELSGLEGEAHKALYERLTPTEKARSRGLLVPAGDLSWPGINDRRMKNRDVISTAGSGGNLVQTDHLGDRFIQSLRNRSRVLSMGCTMLPGRQGDVEIPGESSDTEVFWISENQEIPETTQQFRSIKMSPKTAGAIAGVSRNLLIQSDPAIEMILKENLVASMAIGVDKALLYGDGLKQPLGIFNYPGISSAIAGNPNGGALSYELLAEMESKIFDSNAEGGELAWLCNSQTRKAARTTTENSSNVSQWIWQNLPPGSDAMMGDGMMLGHKAVLSNNLANNSTKASGTNLSHLILGEWSSLIFASWGTIELLPNQFGRSWPTGGIELRILYSVDSCLRHPESFVVCTDVDTAS